MIALTENRNNSLAVKNFSEDLLNDFYAFLDVSEKTLITYRGALKQFFKFLNANGIKNPCHDDILTFKKTLLDAGRKATTVSLYLAAARKFFTWCEQRGIYQNISIGVKSPKVDTGHKRDFVGANQLKKILADMPRNSLESKRDYAIIALMASCGLRTIEVVRANVGDIRNLGDNTVLYVQGKGKTSKSDFVKLTQQVLNTIRDYLNERGNVADDAPLFASISRRNYGGRLTTYSVSRICKNAFRLAGINSSRITAHSLRHSAVTFSLMSGISLPDVQAFARHSSLNTTMIYNHSIQRINSLCESNICAMIF